MVTSIHADSVKCCARCMDLFQVLSLFLSLSFSLSLSPIDPSLPPSLSLISSLIFLPKPLPFSPRVPSLYFSSSIPFQPLFLVPLPLRPIHSFSLLQTLFLCIAVPSPLCCPFKSNCFSLFMFFLSLPLSFYFSLPPLSISICLLLSPFLPLSLSLSLSISLPLSLPLSLSLSLSLYLSLPLSLPLSRPLYLVWSLYSHQCLSEINFSLCSFCLLITYSLLIKISLHAYPPTDMHSMNLCFVMQALTV